MPGDGAVLRAGRGRIVDAVALVVVLVVAALAFDAHFDSSRRRATGDTYYYLTQALEFAGVPTEQARRQAGEVVCAEIHRLYVRSHRGTDCVRYEVNPPQRYLDIFTSRPGWPLVLSPFVGLFGPWTGAVLATFLLALLAAALVHAALRLVTGAVGAAAGAIAFSLLGTGTWAAWLLPEGAAAAATALALLGATLVLRGRRDGLAVVAVALVLAYACKPANGAAVSAALLAGGLVLVALPGTRSRAALVATAGAAGLAGWALVSRALSLPSLHDTLQDLATRHYARPDVPDPWRVLVRLDRRLWGEQLDRWWGVPQPLPVILLACLVAVVTLRRAGVVWALVALSAVGIVVLHPLASEYERLIAPAWLAVCAAVAGGVDAVLRRWGFSTCAGAAGRDDQEQHAVALGAPQEEP
jgi:hypothetical protein